MPARIADTVKRMVKGLNVFGQYILLALMAVVMVDIALRFFFSKPIKGSFELSEFMLAAIIWFGLAHNFAIKGNIKIDMLVNHLSPRVQAILKTITCLLALALFGLIVWRGTVQALATLRIGETSDILRLPIGLLKMMVPLGAFVVCLELLMEMVSNVAQMVGKPNPDYQVSKEVGKPGDAV